MLFTKSSIFLWFAAAQAVDTLVELDYAKYDGVANDTGVTHWWGMRFAAAPVGALRFGPPQDPKDEGDRIIPADQHGLVCRSTPGPPESKTTDEDCLFVDVYAPTEASTDKLLPVYFYISGGGFNAISDANLNGTSLIQASNHSIVVVTFNYRVGLFGFLASKEVESDPTASVNNGLKDQRKALAWVQKYIHHFGGDPAHVTIGGASAGAASVAYHLTAYNGRNDGLFQAAAAESQSFGTQLTVAESQYQYDNIIQKVNCSTASDTLACLRSVSAVDIQRVNNNIPYPGASGAPTFMYSPVVDNDLVPDLTYRLFQESKFIDVPVIFGDDTNGGTVFVPSNTTTRTEQDAYLHNNFPSITQAQLDTLNDLYPNPNATCPNTGCLWRKTSNIYGDLRYMCPGLFISERYANYSSPASSWSSWSSSSSPSYNYLYNVSDPSQIAQGLGVPHTVERSAIWGYGYPASYAAGESNEFIVPWIQGYWVSFIKAYDPNVWRVEGSPRWETWGKEKGKGLSGGGSGGERLVFETEQTTEMREVDAAQSERCNYAWEIGVQLKQR